MSLPLLLIELGRADVMDQAEGASLVASRETWQRQHRGEAGAWLLPTANGEQVLDPPPMTTWVHMIAWWGLEPASADSGTLLYRARFTAVLMGVLALVSTYWAGISLGGVRTARLAALALGTTLFFLHAARLATSEMILLGWYTLAVAAGFWAIRPLKPIQWVGRRVLGWPLAGLALAAAILTTGPAALALFLVPIGTAILLTPLRRVGDTLGLTFALLLGVSITLPWYLHVLDGVPGAWERLISVATDPQVPGMWPSLAALGWVTVLLSPWQVSLFGALADPFVRFRLEGRRTIHGLIAWLWLLLLALLCLVRLPGLPAHPVLLLPPFALMVGQLWARQADLAEQRVEELAARILRACHWLLLGAASVALPLLLMAAPSPWHGPAAGLPPLHWPWALALGALLLVAAGLGARWHFKWRPRQAAYATVAWMVVAAGTWIFLHANAPSQQNPGAAAAHRIHGLGDVPTFLYLHHTEADRPDPTFVFYLARGVRPIRQRQLEELSRHGAGELVLVRGTTENRQLMGRHGFERLLQFQDRSAIHRDVYRAPVAAPPDPEG